MYNNVFASSYTPASADEPFIVRLAIDGSVASAANVSDLSDGTYAVTYRVTAQGTHTLSVSTPLTGALQIGPPRDRNKPITPHGGVRGFRSCRNLRGACPQLHHIRPQTSRVMLTFDARVVLRRVAWRL